jgi:acyl-CoA synthetase (NDP forming)
MADEILGFRSYRRVREIGKPVDLAVVSTPREQVAGIIEECASVGIKAAIIVPQGFADADEAGRGFQKDLSRIARQRAIRLMGPNTLGTVNAFSGFTSSFMPLRREKVPIGVICQSGIFLVGSSLFTGMLGKGIDLGNGCDLDFADALAYFGQDDDIRVIFIAIAADLPDQAYLDATDAIERVAAACPEKPAVAWLYGANQACASRKLEKSHSVVAVPTLPRAARVLEALYTRHLFLDRMRVYPPVNRPGEVSLLS